MFTGCAVRDPEDGSASRHQDGSWQVKCRFVAAEVARDVRHDVHAGTSALKAVRMIVSLAATRDGRHRPRSIAFYDIVAAFVHASIGEVVGVVPQEGLKALHCPRMASQRWQRHHMRVLRTREWIASNVMPGFFHHRDPCQHVRMPRRRFHGRGQ